MSNKINQWSHLIAFAVALYLCLVCINDNDYGFSFFLSIIIAIFSAWAVLSEDKINRSSYKMEILNDYIIIEPQELKLNSTLQLTAQDQSRLVYKDAMVKFTPKNSRVKPGDIVVYNKAMAYPYVLDGKQHLIITEEYIVLIK